MKRILKKVNNLCAKMVSFVKTVSNAVRSVLNRSCSVIAGNKAEGFVDTAVKILMAVVIGALVLAGLYLLFSGTILPTLTQRIQDMFNYNG